MNNLINLLTVKSSHVFKVQKLKKPKIVQVAEINDDLQCLTHIDMKSGDHLSLFVCHVLWLNNRQIKTT